jgi:GGDEF domain-containing protein
LRIHLELYDRYRSYTSASIGIAVGARERPQELVHAADVAMYQAEGMGKGCSAFSDPEAKGAAPT